MLFKGNLDVFNAKVVGVFSNAVFSFCGARVVFELENRSRRQKVMH